MFSQRLVNFLLHPGKLLGEGSKEGGQLPHARAKKPDIKWNFTKFLINRQGQVVARFEPTAPMSKVEDCIKSLLSL